MIFSNLPGINLRDVEARAKNGEANLVGYKILGSGNISGKIKIIASAASKSAMEKVKKAGGEIVFVG